MLLKTRLFYFFIISFYASQSFAISQVRLCSEDSVLFPWLTGDNKGLVLTQLHIVEKSLKIKLNLIRLPWKRCLQKASLGEFDGVVSAGYNDERAAWGKYPTNESGILDREYRLYTDSYDIYTRKDSLIKYENGIFQNLGKKPIGAQLGYTIVGDLKAQGLAVHESFSSPEDILKELDRNTLEIAILLNLETAKVLSDHPKLKENITISQCTFKVADQFLLFTKKFYLKNSALSKSIWIEVKKTRSDPLYLMEEKKYLNQIKK